MTGINLNSGFFVSEAPSNEEPRLEWYTSSDGVSIVLLHYDGKKVVTYKITAQQD